MYYLYNHISRGKMATVSRLPLVAISRLIYKKFGGCGVIFYGADFITFLLADISKIDLYSPEYKVGNR